MLFLRRGTVNLREKGRSVHREAVMKVLPQQTRNNLIIYTLKKKILIDFKPIERFRLNLLDYYFII